MDLDQSIMQKAEVLIEALPYIQRFNRKIIVVKYGGSAMVDEELKKNWQADVMELQEEVIFDKNEEMKGRELYVFIEGQVDTDNAYVGRTYRDAPDIDGYIFINTDETLMTGDIVKVKVTGAYEYDLIGEICD